MVEAIARLDEKGRIRIPKRIREAAELTKGACVTIKTKDKTIIIEPVQPAADKYYGTFRVDNWPQDLNKTLEETVQKRWKQHAT